MWRFLTLQYVVDLVRNGELLAVPRSSPRLGLRMRERALVQILHKVLREKDVECPIDRDADFLLDPRQFTPINAAPEKPGEKSREVHAENPRHSRTATDRCQQPQRFETEW